MKKRIGERQQELAAIAAKADAEIDLSEMPEGLDWSDAQIGKFVVPHRSRSHFAWTGTSLIG